MVNTNMWFFRNKSGWLYRYDSSDKQQATSVKSHAPIFRQQAGTLKRQVLPATSGHPQARKRKLASSSRKTQAP